ncbi:MAG: hypothetical protein C4326_03475 [Ignavibacteria bacterium]
MEMQAAVLRTLLYYDIWSHPLTEEELFTFLPVNSMTFEQFREQLRAMPRDVVTSRDGFYFLTAKSSAVVKQRLRRMRHARRMWLLARFGTHVIKRFPFVRAVFVSGDLSKNATHKKSDVDFFIVTEPGRLWITRTLLVLFKKVVFLNSKKFFCINSLVATDALQFDEHNIYTATEVATLKPLYNSKLFFEYLKANEWIKQYFPNFEPKNLWLPACNNKASVLQRLLELPFRLIDADRLDVRLMEMMRRVWAQRYPTVDEQTRARIFRCTRGDSRAFVGNFQEAILALYAQRLNRFGLTTDTRFWS